MENNQNTGEKITQGLFITFLGLNIILGSIELYNRYTDKKNKDHLQGCGSNCKCGGCSKSKT